MSVADTTIQIRIDKKTKEGAKKVFSKIGLDMSTALKIFLKQVERTKSLPIKGLTENGFTPEYEDLLINEAKWAKKHGKRYSSVDEMHNAILGNKFVVNIRKKKKMVEGFRKAKNDLNIQNMVG